MPRSKLRTLTIRLSEEDAASLDLVKETFLPQHAGVLPDLDAVVEAIRIAARFAAADRFIARLQATKPLVQKFGPAAPPAKRRRR